LDIFRKSHFGSEFDWIAIALKLLVLTLLRASEN
jgi:hypothetical protein